MAAPLSRFVVSLGFIGLGLGPLVLNCTLDEVFLGMGFRGAA